MTALAYIIIIIFILFFLQKWLISTYGTALTLASISIS